MKYVFQLIRAENGQRSEEFVSSRHDLAKVLAQDVEGVAQDDLVLVLGECNSEGDAYKFSRAPVMKVSSFIQHFAEGVHHV